LQAAFIGEENECHFFKIGGLGREEREGWSKGIPSGKLKRSS